MQPHAWSCQATCASENFIRLVLIVRRIHRKADSLGAMLAILQALGGFAPTVQIALPA